MGILTRLRRPGTASLYEKIGGHDALEVVVEDFYCRVLDDDHLAGFYAGSNMKCVKARQVEFLSAVLGVPE
jgi:hemoglobin